MHLFDNIWFKNSFSVKLRNWCISDVFGEKSLNVFLCWFSSLCWLNVN